MQCEKSELCQNFHFIGTHNGQDKAVVAEYVIVKVLAVTVKELVTWTLKHEK